MLLQTIEQTIEDFKSSSSNQVQEGKNKVKELSAKAKAHLVTRHMY